MDWLQLSLATSPPSLLTLRKAKSRPAVPVSTAPSNPSYDTTSEVGTTGEANKKRSGRLGVGWVTGEIDDVVTMAQWRFFFRESTEPPRPRQRKRANSQA